MDDEAMKAAKKIWEDLADRAGSDGLASVRYDDPLLYQEILDTWATIIRGAMADSKS